MDIKTLIDMGGWGVAAALTLYAARQFDSGRWVFGWLYKQLEAKLLDATARADTLNARMEAMLMAHQDEIEARITQQQLQHDNAMQQLNQRLTAKQQTIDRLTGGHDRKGAPGESDK